MRVKILFYVIVASASMGAAYLAGYWRFNYPPRDRYPHRGVDVSHHQGRIVWEQVKASGYSFAYIKATEGRDFIDPQFRENWTGACKAGVTRGAYHFYLVSRTGREQADNFIRTVPVEPNALPPVVDFEPSTAPESPSARERVVTELRLMLGMLRAAYSQEPVLYVTSGAYEDYLKGEDLPERIWLRSIFVEPRNTDPRWLIWQYANNGRVDGVPERVDLNVLAGDGSEILPQESLANREDSTNQH